MLLHMVMHHKEVEGRELVIIFYLMMSEEENLLVLLLLLLLLLLNLKFALRLAPVQEEEEIKKKIKDGKKR